MQIRLVTGLGLLLFGIAPQEIRSEDWILFTLAGTGSQGIAGDGGPANEAKLNQPFGVTIGPDGAVYFCDTGNHAIRRIDRESGSITTVA